MGHQPDWDAAEVVETELNPLLEEAHLVSYLDPKTSQTCNLDCGLTLRDAWTTH